MLLTFSSSKSRSVLLKICWFSQFLYFAMGKQPARNEERAMQTINRWDVQKRLIESGGLDKIQGRRPKQTQECNDVKDAEHWRRTVINEARGMIKEIQDSSLGGITFLFTLVSSVVFLHSSRV